MASDEERVLQLLKVTKDENRLAFNISFTPLSPSVVSQICTQTQLKSLSLAACEITQIPDDMAKLTNLKALSLGLNQLHDDAVNFSSLEALEDINLSNNYFTTVPATLISTSLRELNMRCNPLEKIVPESFKPFFNTIQVIHFSSCNLEHIPQILLELPNLEELYMDNNKLTKFPIESNVTCVMSKLVTLDVSRNQITEFPYGASPQSKNEEEKNKEETEEKSKTRFSQKYPNLLRLKLQENNIEYIHPDVSSHESLQVLELSNNQITSVESLQKLGSVKVLQLSANNIETLPAEFGKHMFGLQNLLLAYNNLENVPDTIMDITSLKSLDLIGNKIFEMPPNLYHKPKFNLKVVDEAVPDEILPNLYLSSAQFPRNKHAMKRRGITHVLTVAHILPPHPKDFKYKMIDVDDHPGVDLMAHFEECHEFIQEALDSGGAISIHCAAGISRSATIVISYVMKSLRFPYGRAFDFVRQKRPVVRPNEGFVQQLLLYEQQLGLRSKDEDKSCTVC